MERGENKTKKKKKKRGWKEENKCDKVVCAWPWMTFEPDEAEEQDDALQLAVGRTTLTPTMSSGTVIATITTTSRAITHLLFITPPIGTNRHTPRPSISSHYSRMLTCGGPMRVTGMDARETRVRQSPLLLPPTNRAEVLCVVPE
jgi:hypothetical protein